VGDLKVAPSIPNPIAQNVEASLSEPTKSEYVNRYSLEAYFNATANELSKENVDHEKIFHQMCSVFKLLCHQGTQYNHEFVNESGHQLMIEVKKVQKSYKSWTVLAFTVISGGLQIAGGVFSGISAFGQYTGGGLQKIGTMCSGIGQGTGSLSSIFRDQQEGKRAVYQMIISNMQSDRDQYKQSTGQLYGNAETLRNTAKAADDARKAALQALAS
jgi:hypothetical protein